MGCIWPRFFHSKRDALLDFDDEPSIIYKPPLLDDVLTYSPETSDSDDEFSPSPLTPKRTINTKSIYLCPTPTSTPLTPTRQNSLPNWSYES